MVTRCHSHTGGQGSGSQMGKGLRSLRPRKLWRRTATRGSSSGDGPQFLHTLLLRSPQPACSPPSTPGSTLQEEVKRADWHQRNSGVQASSQLELSSGTCGGTKQSLKPHPQTPGGLAHSKCSVPASKGVERSARHRLLLPALTAHVFLSLKKLCFPVPEKKRESHTLDH